MKHEDTSGQRVRVVALSVGQEHFAQGNPGPEANFARLLEFAEASIPQQPDIICFPEFAITGCPYLSPEEVRAEGEPVPGDGPYYRQYAALARNSKAVVCGWMVEKETDEIYHNTSFLVAPDGAFIGQYRKVHPTPGEEGRWGFVPGDDIPVFDLGFVKLGIAICWDMSFPEVCRSIMLRGADLILHPTVGNDRRDMCPVRCKENGLPMVISVFTDSSYALDADGKVMADLDGKGGYVVCDLYPPKGKIKYELHYLERTMFLARRRPAVYGALTDSTAVVPWTEVFETPDGVSLSEEELRRQFPKLRNGAF